MRQRGGTGEEEDEEEEKGPEEKEATNDKPEILRVACEGNAKCTAIPLAERSAAIQQRPCSMC